MICRTTHGQPFDLEKDFSSTERHILQKLLIWKDFAASVAEFRCKLQEALAKGWGDSGAVHASPALKRVTPDMEVQVALRLLADRQARG
jgi:hypothetical protein